MPFHTHGTQSNDNGSFLSISDCSEGQERLAVVAVYRHCKGAGEGEVLAMLGLTGTAEGMLAARDARAG